MGFPHALLTALRFGRRSPQAIRFADIEWGDRRDVVEGKLRSSGFEVAGYDGDDIGFRGRYAGYDGEGWVYMGRHGAVKTIFVVRPEPELLLATYDRLRQWLVRRYGQPPLEVERFEPPFADAASAAGTERALQALRAGKAVIATAWPAARLHGAVQAEDPGMVLRLASDSTVKLSCESSPWHAEFERRTAAAR